MRSIPQATQILAPAGWDFLQPGQTGPLGSSSISESRSSSLGVAATAAAVKSRSEALDATGVGDEGASRVGMGAAGDGAAKVVAAPGTRYTARHPGQETFLPASSPATRRILPHLHFNRMACMRPSVHRAIRLTPETPLVYQICAGISSLGSAGAKALKSSRVQGFKGLRVQGLKSSRV